MHIELHSTFRALLINEPADDTQTLYPGSGTLQLPALLDELRVVILSEGGSGKTEEIQHATRQLLEEGKAAFFMRLEHVAHDFDSAFVEGDLAELEKWLASPEPGWLLLDSVDEPRLRSAQDFELAIRKVAARISKAKQRRYLLVTGRAAAWSPKSDLDLCNSLFPVANEVTAGREDADLCWTCTAFNGPVPTELKIADNWSGPELFDRLENRHAGDYLRDDASVRGIFLLVWRGVQNRWHLPGRPARSAWGRALGVAG